MGIGRASTGGRGGPVGRVGAASARLGASAVEAVLRSPRLRPLWRRRFDATVTTARWLRWIDRRTDTRIDPSRAGRALLVAAPDAVGRLADRLPRGCALVSAANGKTTTTNLLAAIVTAGGHDPVVNHVGANMPGGVCAELVGRSGRRRPAPDLGVFEVDELWLDQLVPPLAPRVIALGNLFRDQLDRMGELDRVAARWRDFVERLPAATVLVVNADDPRVCQLAAGRAPVVHVGCADVDRDSPPPGADVPDCARCGATLRYDGAHIGHLGRWWCPGCGDRRPRPDVEASDIRLHGLDGAEFTLTVRRQGGAMDSRRATIGVPGRFNVANAALAAGVAVALGVGLDAVVTGLRSSPGAFGRAERLRIGDRDVTLVLAKNPTGLDEVVTMLTAGDGPLDLLFLLNDRDLDGRDVSWVWDAELERLAPALGGVTCGGSRAAEAALRLDYAGVDAGHIVVVDDIADALATALARTAGHLVAVTNYSAMLDLRETVAEQGHAARYWW